MKLRECKLISDAGAPQIHVDELDPLWISDFYDGPLAGAVIYSGQLSSYVLAEEETPPFTEGWYRRYWLLQLTPTQQDEERHWHELFRTHVGTHWDRRSARTEPGHVKPIENHQLFYEPYARRKPMILDDNDVVGWFQF